MPKVYITIVNYNGWGDTIECLETIFRSNYNNYQIIVVDNASSNSSMANIKKWADGELCLWINDQTPLKHLTSPADSKKLRYIYLNEHDIKPTSKTKKSSVPLTNNERPLPLILIQASSNRGFAAGNNIAMKFALLKNDFEYIWLLNNDTVIPPETLSSMILKMERIESKNIGMLGNVLLFYQNPETVQALGGKYNKWIGIPKHIAEGTTFSNLLSQRPKPDYIIGASIFVKKGFILDVGLMTEDYFLYYEELDWIERGKQKHWDFIQDTEIKVYHKAGASTGTNSKRNLTAEAYLCRSQIKFAKRFYKKYLPGIYFGLILLSLRWLIAGDLKRALKIIQSVTRKNL